MAEAAVAVRHLHVKCFQIVSEIKLRQTVAAIEEIGRCFFIHG